MTRLFLYFLKPSDDEGEYCLFEVDCNSGEEVFVGGVDVSLLKNARAIEDDGVDARVLSEVDPNSVDDDVVDGRGRVEDEITPHTLFAAPLGDLDNVFIALLKRFL